MKLRLHHALKLRRMHIHVHFRERNPEKEHDPRVLPFHEQVFIAVKHRMGENLVPHVTAINESDEVAGVGEGCRSDAQIPLESQLALCRGKRNQVSRGIASQNLMQAVLTLVHRGIISDGSTVMEQSKMNSRVG